MSPRWGVILGSLGVAVVGACTSFSAEDAHTPGIDAGADAQGPGPGVDAAPAAFDAGSAPCSAGTCPVELFATVVGTEQKALGIAVTDTRVYVAIEGTAVHIFDKATRNDVETQGFGGVEYIAVDANNLYGTTGNDGEWGFVSLSGGALTRNPIGGAPLGVAVSGSELYYADSKQGTVSKLSLPDGGPSVLGTLLSSPEGLAVDPSGLYYVAENSGGAIKRGSQMAAPSPFDTDVPAGPAGVAVDDTYVYYACQGTREVYRKRKDGTTDRELLAAFPEGRRPGGVAVDGTHVYWTVFETNEIWRVAK
jgi:DNA-binding beta-propeller fold protein YncE